MLLLGSEAPVTAPRVADFSLLFLQSKSPLFSLYVLLPILLTMLHDIHLCLFEGLCWQAPDHVQIILQ